MKTKTSSSPGPLPRLAAWAPLVPLLALALAPPARAACPLDGSTPFTAGPVDPVNGFSEWVQDSNGVTLSLCLDGDGATGPCFYDPPIPGNTFSETIGFGPEAFWWLAEAEIETDALLADGKNTFSALVVMAAEAAWNTEVPIPGDQFPFTRLRLRVDAPAAGLYTVTHPYGTQTFEVTTPDRRAVNESFDIPFAPDAVNDDGRVGPWLRHVEPPPPAGYIGHGNLAGPFPVTGSPCGTNYFRVTAVGPNGTTPIVIDPDDIDGDGSTNSVATNLFGVFGKLFVGTVPTPLTVDAANYSRTTAGRVNVFATAPGSASLTFEGDPNLPAGAQAMAGDGSGRFFGTVELADASTLPDEVSVTATNASEPNNTPTTRVAPLVDLVTITVAEARCSGGLCSLHVEAGSSDLGDPPTLTASWFGQSGRALTGGVLTTDPTVPLAAVPATVTVSSSAGGSDSEPVRVVHE